MLLAYVDVHVTFSRQEDNFWQNYGILDLDNFRLGFRLGFNIG